MKFFNLSKIRTSDLQITDPALYQQTTITVTTDFLKNIRKIPVTNFFLFTLDRSK